MKYLVWAKGPSDLRHHIVAMFNARADAEQYMTEFLSDRPGFHAEIRLY